MRRIVAVVALLLCACMGQASAQAQNFGIELRGGASFPTEDLQQTALKTGGGFEALASYRIMPHVVTYLGWDWNLMGMDEPFAGANYEVVSTGYALGMQFQHPIRGRFGGFARGGVIYNHIELEDDDGDIAADSGHELGWEAGAGLRVALTERLTFTPGVRYRTFSADLELGTATIPVDLSYVAAEIGFALSFGPAPIVSAAGTR